MSNQKEILILGSTGSIGINTINVIRQFPQNFKVTGLTVNSNIDELEKQIKELMNRQSELSINQPTKKWGIK
jgi:1-deoxy-D-xylulose-5-phosphate reductoisomerase